ncbi:hypothetical protein Leryth_016685 [Lithospermum erythrorhizon]|nr:hypothetical protein Leryth_016685 [Lithospermum erythrorhizon]
MLASLESLLTKSLQINHAKQIHALILTNAFRHLQPQLLQLILKTHPYNVQTTTHYIKNIIKYSDNNLDTFSITSTIRFFSKNNNFKHSIKLYAQLHYLGLVPSSFAISSALKCCAKVLDDGVGVLIHTHVFKYGFCDCVYVQTSLVDFYAKLGSMDIARKVFVEMRVKNVVSWNSVLAGYVKCGEIEVAQKLFDEMPERDVVSWNSMVLGYGKVGNMDQAEVLFRLMPQRNAASWNVMISGYVNSGFVELARRLFDEMPYKNGVSYVTMITGYSKQGDVEAARKIFAEVKEKGLILYNAMIACYVQNGLPNVAVSLFNKMCQPDVSIQPDKMTLASIISACSLLGDKELVASIETYLSKMAIDIDDHLTTSLVDLYAKSGNIDKAYELFHCLQKKDLVAYTAMILGCGINGRENDAIRLFSEMIDAGVSPNLATFTGTLTAYNHLGMVDNGWRCFMTMQEFGLVPSVDHYAIMVDLLGRAGRLKEAHDLIKSMPMKPHAGVWGALLLGCSLHNHLEFGEVAAKHCMELEPDSTGYCTLLANIYASTGRWADAEKLRKLVRKSVFTKAPGSSWIG